MYHSTTNLLLALSVAAGTLAHATTGAKKLRPQSQHVVRTGRFLAEVPLPKRVSIGPNYKSYLFELSNSSEGQPGTIVKLSYRFDLSDPELPKTLFRYSLLHKFNMLRDETCDETVSSLAQSYRFDTGGAYLGVDASLIYSDGAPMLSQRVNESVPCYVVTPNDYKVTLSEVDTKTRKHTHPRSEGAQ